MKNKKSKRYDFILKDDFPLDIEQSNSLDMIDMQIDDVDSYDIVSDFAYRERKKRDILSKRRFMLQISETPSLSLKRFIIILIACFINSVGVGGFLIPGLLIDGSMSGTAIIINKLSGVPMSYLLMGLNLPFFIFASRKLNRNYLIYSVFAVLGYAFAMYILQNIANIGDVIIGRLSNDSKAIFKTDYVMLLCAVFGGGLSGLGSGLIIRMGGTLDGIEVSAVMISKRTGFTVGQIIMAYNTIMLLISIFVFSLTTALMSMLAYVVAGKMIDLVVEGLDKSKAAMIISNHGAEIAKLLNEQLGRGVTIINGNGYFGDDSKKIVYYVVNRFEISTMKDIVLSIDKDAFIAINDVSDVLGKRVSKRMR